jgi:hypothetical protein
VGVSPARDRKFVAKRFNLMGNEVETSFLLSQVDKGGISNPFASFRVGSELYYVFGEAVADPSLKQALSQP